MADTELDRVLDSVPWAAGEADESQIVGRATNAVESAIIRWITPSGSMVPPWWSKSRDKYLRNQWKLIDPIKTAVNTFTNKAVTIPLKISAGDRNVRRHVVQAQQQQEILMNYSGMMNGWKDEFKKFIQDYLTQDNGAFMLIQAASPINRPILGMPLGIQHLDSGLCERTGDPRFPVIYSHTDGERYLIHRSRIIMMSNLPSPEYDMFNVGHCAFTCALDSGIELRDVYTYMQEKFGSRPKRQLLYIKTGGTLQNLVDAISYGDEKMDSEGLARFSKTVLLAPMNPNGELDIGMIDLASTPDNFNRRDVQLINMSMVASSFGLDVQDLAIAYGMGGSLNTASEVQERKGRGKGVGEMLETLALQLNERYLPEHLKLSFDNQDDAQDEEQAKIWNIRSTARQRDLTTGSTTVQVERARMLRTNEITEDEYASMELLDGRLPNGSSIIAIFFSRDNIYKKYLTYESENITNPEKNDPEAVMDWIDEQEIVAYQDLEIAPTANVSQKIFEVLAGLSHLRALYEGYREEQEQILYAEEMRATEIDEQAALEAEATGMMDDEQEELDEQPI